MPGSYWKDLVDYLQARDAGDVEADDRFWSASSTNSLAHALHRCARKLVKPHNGKVRPRDLINSLYVPAKKNCRTSVFHLAHSRYVMSSPPPADGALVLFFKNHMRCSIEEMGLRRRERTRTAFIVKNLPVCATQSDIQALLGISEETKIETCDFRPDGSAIVTMKSELSAAHAVAVIDGAVLLDCMLAVAPSDNIRRTPGSIEVCGRNVSSPQYRPLSSRALLSRKERSRIRTLARTGLYNLRSIAAQASSPELAADCFVTVYFSPARKKSQDSGEPLWLTDFRRRLHARAYIVKCTRDQAADIGVQLRQGLITLLRHTLENELTGSINECLVCYSVCLYRLASRLG